MPRARFLGVTRDEYVHRPKGGTVYAHHAKNEEGLTVKVRNPAVVYPGEEFDVDEFEAGWLQAMYPNDFKIMTEGAE